MSAFNVTDQHIHYLVVAANRWHESFRRPAQTLDEFKAQAIMLRNANIQSINYRYEENTPLVEEFPITIRDVLETRTDAMQALKAIHCMDYQCCETPQWESTPAAEWLRDLEGNIIRALPGYEEAEWEIGEPALAQ